MKLILIRFAKDDDGTIASKLSKVLQALESELSTLGELKRITQAFDFSCMSWLLDTKTEAKAIASAIHGVQYMSVHDEVLVLQVGTDVAHIALSVPMAWMGRRLRT